MLPRLLWRFDKAVCGALQSPGVLGGPPAGSVKGGGSMPVRVGINGFGRIGRITFRAMQREYANDLQVVAINDLTDAQTNAHLLKYDSNYGTFPGTVIAEERALVVDGERIRVFAEKDPAAIPWRDVGA